MATTKTTLPAGWRWAKLGDVIAHSQPGFASGERDSNGVIQLRMNNVDTRGNLVWDEFLRVPADQTTIEKFRLKRGDVVFNNTNSTELVGKSALFFEHDEPVVYSNHFTRLRVKPDLADPGFVTFWLNSQWQQKTFENICNRWIGQSAVKNDKLLAHVLKVCGSDKLAVWNFQSQTYLITKAAWHGSCSTFTQQALDAQNVEQRETKRGTFERRGAVN